MKKYEAIKASQLSPSDLTFENLQYLYETGRSYTISGSGKNRVTGYRSGVQTEIGDLEISEWKDLMQKLICESGEDQIQQCLLSWVKENCPWLHNKSEQEMEALVLHSMRIFEDKEWAGYEGFIRICPSIKPPSEEK